MKIMTFNTQHCLNYKTRMVDFQIMADTIHALQPDIVGLNEMRDRGSDPEYTEQTKMLAELTGMEHYYFAQAILAEGDNPYGNAILSKKPFLSAETVMIPDPIERNGQREYESRCILKATFAGGLTVLISHFGLNAEEKKSAVETVLLHITDEKCILMGDFNVPPDEGAILPLQNCMTDAATVMKAPLMSWPSDAPQRKLDYIFVSPDIEILSADIPAVVASDHRPHIATLRVPGIE